MTEQPKVYLSPPHLSGDEEAYVRDAFQSNWIAPVGYHIDLFEQELARLAGVRDAVVVSSGTAAIHLALALLEVKQGDTIFCSTFTFVASANPILYQGAEPVFIDSEPDTWNMSPHALRKAMEEADSQGRLPKAVIVVHLYGQSAKMDELLAVCHEYNVPLIEDAAESLGTTYNGKMSGSMGTMGIFSFNGNKIITTSGGGALVSNNPELIQKARFLATQAKEPAHHYEHRTLGYNYKLSNILASIGRSQLKVLNDRVRARRDVFSIYKHALEHMPGVHLMPALPGTIPNRWLTTITVDFHETKVTPMDIFTRLYNENIEARPLWKPLHLQPLFRGRTYYPHNEWAHVAQEKYEIGICLPSGSNMRVEEQLRVIKCIHDTFNAVKEKKVFIPGKQEV